MKKTLFLISVLALTSCDNYETLRDKFTFKPDKNFDFVGANTTQVNGVPVAQQPQIQSTNDSLLIVNKQGAAPTGASYEIAVNSPVGSTITQAMATFKNEARKVCRSDNYTQQITSSGLEPIREYGMKQVKDIQVPSVKGIVTCK